MAIGDVLCLLALGLFAGVAGGLVGIGGSIIMIPGMAILLGTGQHVAQGAALMVNCFVAAPAAWQHLRHRAIVGSTVCVLVPTAAVSAIAGVWVSELPFFAGLNQLRLSKLFGAFLVYIACYDAWRVVRPPKSRPAVDGRLRSFWGRVGTVVIGIPTGFAGGLLGIGGGIVCVPLQQVLLRMPLRNAIANSAATIICVSITGATAKNYCLVSDGTAFWTMGSLAAALIPAAFVGGLIGGKLTHVLPQRIVRVALGLVVVAAAYKLLTRTPESLPQPRSHAAVVADSVASDRPSGR